MNITHAVGINGDNGSDFIELTQTPFLLLDYGLLL